MPACQQHLARCVAKGLQAQCGAVSERFGAANGVNARQKAANPGQDLKVFKLRPPATATGRHAESKALEVVQRAAVQLQRTHHRHFSCHQLVGKRVLFNDLRVCPAVWPIELGNHHIACCARFTHTVFKMNLVDPVFITRQRHQAAVAMQPYAGQRVQHHVGCQGLIGVRGFRGGGGKGLVHFPIVRPGWHKGEKKRRRLVGLRRFLRCEFGHGCYFGLKTRMLVWIEKLQSCCR